MTTALSTRLDRVVARLPRTYAGPGGAVAVLRDGQVLVRHTWGWANAERRIPFTPSTLFRMCSITKQFTCGVVLDVFRDPSVLDSDIRARMPRLEESPPTALHLCHNQSGLRDYWAVAMMQGSPAEAPFGDHEADRIVAATRTLQFQPGRRYSYVNQNFRMLSEIAQSRTGRRFADLLRERIFDPAGMESAILAADTSAMPDGTTGYEGSVERGFRAAENRVLWTGDAGLGASLNDMIAWERFIDAARDDGDALYSKLSGPVTFENGSEASYGFGLSRSTEFGRLVLGHGGALRGWRSHRLYVPSERVSVVVMFNHMADTTGAAMELLAAVLDAEMPVPDATLPSPKWLGAYLELESGLSARIETAAPGQIRLRFGHNPEMLDLCPDGSAGRDGGTRLRTGEDGLWMDRPRENWSVRLHPLDGAPAIDVAGHYRCEVLGCKVTVEDTKGVLYGAFSGFLGQGRMEMLEPVGPDVWALPCPRALDHTPPGDWTLRFRRDDEGRVTNVDVGCWLARRLDYARIE